MYFARIRINGKLIRRSHQAGVLSACSRCLWCEAFRIRREPVSLMTNHPKDIRGCSGSGTKMEL
jgi:hypothetical protein